MADRESLGAGLVGPYRWESDPHDPSAFVVTRPPSNYRMRHVSTHATALIRSLQQDWQREKETTAALGSDDPLALCRLGWHSLGDSILDRGPFFRWMSGRIGERLNYWVGREPYTWSSTRMAGLGQDAVPWRCSVCDEQTPKST